MWLVYLASFGVAFLSVFLKGFQTKNVIKDLERSAFITSFLQGASQILTTALVVYAGMNSGITASVSMALTAGLGSAFGIVASMRLHNYIFKEGKEKDGKSIPAGTE